MDPFEKGADKGKQRDKEERDRAEKFERLAIAATNRIARAVGGRFKDAGYDFGVSRHQIRIISQQEFGPDLELDVRIFSDENGEPWFSGGYLQYYTTVKRDERLTEGRLIEALGEYFGKTVAGIEASKARRQTEMALQQKYLADQERERKAAQSAKAAGTAFKWIAIAVGIAIVVGLVM